MISSEMVDKAARSDTLSNRVVLRLSMAVVSDLQSSTGMLVLLGDAADNGKREFS